MNKKASVCIRKFTTRNKMNYKIIKELYKNTPWPKRHALKVAMSSNNTIEEILAAQDDQVAR